MWLAFVYKSSVSAPVPWCKINGCSAHCAPSQRKTGWQTMASKENPHTSCNFAMFLHWHSAIAGFVGSTVIWNISWSLKQHFKNIFLVDFIWWKISSVHTKIHFDVLFGMHCDDGFDKSKIHFRRWSGYVLLVNS